MQYSTRPTDLEARCSTVEAVGVLHPKLQQLLRERGWEKLTPVQEKAIPAVKSGANVIIVAPTGQGKTEAALLPVLDSMLRDAVEPVTLLYITPMRALINDIYERIRWWAERLGFRVARKHGDVPQSERARRLRSAPHILVTTPESLEIDLDWAQKFREYYRNVKYVIVDEVHEIVGTRRGAQLAVLLERLRRIAGDFQLILLSATIGSPAEVCRALTGSSSRNIAVVEVHTRKDMEVVIDYVEPRSSRYWLDVAERLKKYIEPLTLIFVNSKHAAERIHEALEKLGVERVAVHHASISAAEKERIEREAKEGKLTAIICTKTLELGVDIGSVKRVVLYRPAGSVASLMQRLGRSGHSIEGKIRGVVVAVTPGDLLEALAEVRLASRGKVEELQGKPYFADTLAKAILGMALAGSYTVEEAYSIVKSTWYFSDVSMERFKRIISKMMENKMIKIEDGKLKVGPSFFRIWRFSRSSGSRRWWERSFSEFFAAISDRDSFTVKSEHGRVIGELDSDYVYRAIRVGSVFRLGGKTWQVIAIDEVQQVVMVREAPGATPNVPMWRGEGPEVSRTVLEELSKVVGELEKGRVRVPRIARLTESAKTKLDEMVDEVVKHRIRMPRLTRMVIDRIGEEVALLNLSGRRAARTIAYALLAEAARFDVESYVKYDYCGVAMKLSDAYNPVEDLVKMSPQELESRVVSNVARTSFFVKAVRPLQLLYGALHKITPEDGIVYEEAVRQALSEYFDLQAAKKLLSGIRSGRVRVEPNTGKASFFAAEVADNPPERYWSLNLEHFIAETVKGMAFTVEELADALGVPEKTVEAKLKEMRKPGASPRVFQFIDVDTGEWRWALVEDAESIALSDEFGESFRPVTDRGLYMLLVKSKDGGLVHVTFTPRELLESPEKLKEKIPFDEAYEVKVIPLSGYYDGEVPRYFHVPKDIIHVVALNAVAVLQRLQRSQAI